MTWVDPPLTELGRLQRGKPTEFIAHQIEIEKMPPPQSIYTSPQTRGLETTDLLYSGLECFQKSSLAPVVTDVSQLPRTVWLRRLMNPLAPPCNEWNAHL